MGAIKQKTLRFFLQGVNDHKIKIFGMVLFDALQAFFLLLLPFVIKDLVNAVQGYHQDSAVTIWEHIQTPFSHFVWLNIALIIVARISGTFLGFTAPFLGIEPRRRLFDHLQKHSFNFFQDSHSGSLGNKIHQSILGLRMSLWTFVFDIWPTLIKFTVATILIFMTDNLMGIILAIWCIAYFSVVAWIGLIKYAIVTRLSHERSLITGIIVDIASNIHTVKSFAHETHERDNIEDAMGGEVKENTKFQYAREAMGWFYSLMAMGLMLGLLTISLERYASGGFSVGDIAFVFSLILLLVEQCRGLSFTFSRFLEYFGQTRDGVETVMQHHTLADDKNADDLKITNTDINIKNICFTYDEATKEPVFKDLSLDIPAGQKIGLVGSSGAGKSTLANLLLRFYDLNEGLIEISGQNISHVTQQSLRRSIAVIPQDTSLFHRSLIDNIRYGNLKASEKDVIAAAKKAYAHDFIDLLPDKYETMVGERGLKLSGGQRQRIAIARAILKDSPILILDEATSALDSESEALIQDALRNLMKGKTVIAIAHRLSTIASLDRLIVMREGKIIEDGTHDMLIKKNGQYAKLWSMQSGGFLKEN